MQKGKRAWRARLITQSKARDKRTDKASAMAALRTSSTRDGHEIGKRFFLKGSALVQELSSALV
jgi:hypothetical protein